MMRPSNLQDRVLQLPLFLLMFGVASASMLVPAIHGGVIRELSTARACVY